MVSFASAHRPVPPPPPRRVRRRRKSRRTAAELTLQTPIAVTPEVTFPSGLRQARAHEGEPLPSGLRASMETSLGRALGSIKVHRGPRASALTRMVKAKAFTLGQDIFFRRTEFQPGTLRGKRLVAHEVAHTMQQSCSGLQSRSGQQFRSVQQSRSGHLRIQRQPQEGEGPPRPLLKQPTDIQQLKQQMDAQCQGVRVLGRLSRGASEDAVARAEKKIRILPKLLDIKAGVEAEILEIRARVPPTPGQRTATPRELEIREDFNKQLRAVFGTDQIVLGTLEEELARARCELARARFRAAGGNTSLLQGLLPGARPGSLPVLPGGINPNLPVGAFAPGPRRSLLAPGPAGAGPTRAKAKLPDLKAITEHEFKVGPLTFKVKLPKEASALLPLRLRTVKSIEIKLSEPGKNAKVTISVNGRVAGGVVVLSSSADLKGKVAGGLSISGPMQVQRCEAVDKAEVSKKVNAAYADLLERVQGLPSSELSGSQAIELITAISDFISAVDSGVKKCEKGPRVSFKVGVEGQVGKPEEEGGAAEAGGARVPTFTFGVKVVF